MTTILDDLETKPTIVGRCVVTQPGQPSPHAIAIYSDDIEAVELMRKGEYACSQCANDLLFSKRVSDEPEKDPKKFTKRSKRTGARLPQGEDLKK